MIDLNAWHHSLHQVTGSMALKFNRAAAADLRGWAETLRSIAGEMEAAPGEPGKEGSKKDQ